MPTLVVALIVSLLSAWPTVTAAGQSRGLGAPTAAQAPALTPDQVKRAQESLKAEGWDPGPVDGVVGPRTRQALRAYQARAGLPQTGVLDATTFQRLAPRAPLAFECTIATPPLPAGTGTGKKYYVATNGSDSHACSQSAPCRTINHAVGRLQAGDTLYVMPGTYKEFVGGDMFGIPRNQIPSNVLFAAAQPGTVTVKGIYLGDVSNVVVDGFVVDVQYTVEVGVGFGGDKGSHNRIQNTEVRNSKHMGIMGEAPYSKLINLHVHHNAVGPNGQSLCKDHPLIGPGLCHGVYSAADHLLIEGGKFHHNEGWGLHLYSGPTNQTVRYACAYENGHTGIGLIHGKNNQAYNNRSYNNGGQGIWDGCYNCVYKNNMVYGNRRTQILTDRKRGSTFEGNIDDKGNPVTPEYTD
jgi:peptidoglycan hydrolase-like protein with peptidoglycan-binding domain